MNNSSQLHTFHIPVMGVAFTVDTPSKVAQYGIDSVVSILEDELLERLRKHFSTNYNIPYSPIEKTDEDYRARRITAYLNTLNEIVTKQISNLRILPMDNEEIKKFMDLLPTESPLKKSYNALSSLEGKELEDAIQDVRKQISAGSIDVNIMTKIDNLAYDKAGNPLPPEYSAAKAALRGFAKSNLTSSIVFSAGLNPKLYSYCADFEDFYPDANGNLKKKIILKVSDYRSALIQGKFFAKKGLWVSEYRVESGLNCGGHAFATEGYLMGPILDEFKNKRNELQETLFNACNEGLIELGRAPFASTPKVRITAQGGVGNTSEHNFLLKHYELDSIGWGSPFLLVQEATTFDMETRKQLSEAKPDDYFLSNASPLGVPFNNFKNSSSEELRKARIAKGKSGSPCLKKYLQYDTEFSNPAICTSSVKYQYLKIKQLKQTCETEEEFLMKKELLQQKDCLCEGLSEPALNVYGIDAPNKFGATTVCPGPNLAYFSGLHSLKEMVDHIYGRINILNQVPRSNLFINELKLYVKYIEREIDEVSKKLIERKTSYFEKFSANLLSGIEYYNQLIDKKESQAEELFNGMRQELDELAIRIKDLQFIKVPVMV
ncbi:MAG: hypothetical protein IT246_08095 [Bacteroidia bacterium]|nr:hypothetical protein [Bacteroidia bacterium]